MIITTKNTARAKISVEKLQAIEKSLKRIYIVTGVAIFLSVLLIAADSAFLFQFGFKDAKTRSVGNAKDQPRTVDAHVPVAQPTGK